MRNLISIIALTLGISLGYAEIPDGYYSGLDGKQGTELKDAICQASSGYVRVTYNTKTWPAFEKTDVREYNGKTIWWDMYSNNIVYLPEHASLNIEHAVANSWWGGKNAGLEAYSDLFHLNPSDQNANNVKGSYPPGETSDARLLDNGLFRVGTPLEGQGGGSASVFEPADEYKGDFARAYFYIFTTYPNLTWDDTNASYLCDTEGNLHPWVVDPLLRWSRQDPVDSKEKNRNEEIYLLQKNRNPFIDYPQLAEYVWGTKIADTFTLADEAESTVVDRPGAPIFNSTRVVGVNTYCLRWWGETRQRVTWPGATELMMSINGGDYESYGFAGETEITLDTDVNPEQHIKAYVKSSVGDYTLTSSTTYLDAYARDNASTDYSDGLWDRVATTSQMQNDDFYIILSSNTLHAMSVTGGNSTRAFLESAGFVDFNAQESVIELPITSAVVKFPVDTDEKNYIEVYDIYGNYKGAWTATAKNKMKLDTTTHTPGVISFGEDGSFIFTFDQFGSLQFNKTQPRFLNYESSQTPVYLYRLTSEHGGGTSAISEIEEKPWSIGVSGTSVTLPEGVKIFDLNGRNVDGRDLQHGIYIVIGKGKAEKIML